MIRPSKCVSTNFLRSHRGRRSVSKLTSSKLDYWRKDNEVLWHDMYWFQHIDNCEHLRLSLDVGGAWPRTALPYVSHTAMSEFKFAYETHFWKLLLNEVGGLTSRGSVLELLPGKTFNVPVALESIGFRGFLDRLDLVYQSDLSRFSFACSSLRENIFAYSKRQLSYDVIIANHVIDDLLMCLHYSETYTNMDVYCDPVAARVAWKELHSQDRSKAYTRKLLHLFIQLVKNMRGGSTLIFREYPSTFELRAGDIFRTRYVASTYRRITEYLSNLPGIDADFLYLETPLIPAGQQFPNSIFLALKK